MHEVRVKDIILIAFVERRSMVLNAECSSLVVSMKATVLHMLLELGLYTLPLMRI
jgi:hypothetical protein